MKKNIYLMLILLLSFFCLTACSSQTVTSDPAIDMNPAAEQQTTTSDPATDMDQATVKQTAYDLLSAWKASDYQDFAVWEQFLDLVNLAEESLGANDVLLKVLSCAVNNGMYSDVDSFIDILQYDKMSEYSGFIDTYSYVSDDCRYENGQIRPLYDLNNNSFGIYNIVTRDYICGSAITDLSAPDDYGYVCLCNLGYYGCFDSTGEKIIGFIYDEPIVFSASGLAVVMTNHKYGVVNAVGNSVLPTMYGCIELFDDIIAASVDDYDLGGHIWSEFALFYKDGAQFTPFEYCDVIQYDERLYAEYNYYAKLANLGDQTWYDLYDGMGNRLIGPGTNIPEVWGVRLPGENGTMVALCDGKLVNEYGISYPLSPKTSIWTEYSYGCVYLTKDLEWLNYSVYDSSNLYYPGGGQYLSSFNKNGYAIASIRIDDQCWFARVVLDTNGNEVDHFILDGYGYLPIDANDYIYIMNYTGSFYGSVLPYGVLNRVTRDFTAYASVQMIEGTNLTIVEDGETGLYGLYDKNVLVLEPVYSTFCSSDGGQIIARRGAEETIYTPTE